MKKYLRVCARLFGFAILSAAIWATPVFAQATQLNEDDCPDGIQISVRINGSNCLAKDDAILVLLKAFIQFMTIGVGLVATGGIVYGGILYAWAKDNAGQTKQAVDIIRNTVIGLLLYVGMYAILNFLIPGGIFS